MKSGLSTQIQDVDVCAESHVIGEVVSGVVGIVINHDVIVVPEPVVGVVIIVGGHLEKITTNIKAIQGTATQTPYMLRAKTSCKTSVLPGTV